MNVKSILVAFVALFAVAGASAQDTEKNKTIADKACGCAENIDGTLPKEKIIEEINSCIRSQKLLYDLTQASADAKKNDDGKKKEYTVVLNDDNSAVLALFNANCETVKELMKASVGDKMSDNTKAIEHYNMARQFTDQKQYDKAIESYKNALKEDPKFATAWAYMGLNYRRLENYNEAIKCYDKALKLNPASEIAMQNKAICYSLLKDFKNASVTYEKFVTLHPENPEGYFGAGSAFYTLGEYYKGIDYMFKAYLKYKETQSPYTDDALQQIAAYYKELKANNKLDIFEKAAKDNNIQLN